MRKTYIVFAAIFFGLALLFALAGLANILFPDPVRLGAPLSVNYGDEPDAGSMLPYLGGCIVGVGLTCIGIVCAIIGNTFINLLIAFRHPRKLAPTPSDVGQ